jgi:hypothetical protein
MLTRLRVSIGKRPSRILACQEEFTFTNAEIGWILGSSNFSDALLQIPGGIFGQVCGPRRALTFIAGSWGMLTLLTGFVPGLMAASAAGAMVSAHRHPLAARRHQRSAVHDRSGRLCGKQVTQSCFRDLPQL